MWGGYAVRQPIGGNSPWEERAGYVRAVCGG